MAISSSVKVLNQVPRDKLPQVLGHILEKRATGARNGDIFSPEEVEQLTAMLQLSASDIDNVVATATELFQEAAAFGDGIQPDVLTASGLNVEVVAILVKFWRKKGRHHVTQLAAVSPLEPTATVRRSQWQLQLTLGDRYVSHQSEALALFQLEIKNEQDVSVNKLDLEMDHTELLAFFKQLNSIQQEIDSASPSVA